MVRLGNINLGEFPLLLAPMEDVSDPPLRQICRQLGADVVITEFISSEGLVRDAAKSIHKLDIFEAERPVGIQLFGGDIEVMQNAAKLVEQANPDFIDINFGCPVKKVVCKGAGAAILKDVAKMVQMTRKIVENTELPVTVKTRLGWDENSINIVEVALKLQEAGIKGLTIHARTRSQLYKGIADWSWIQKVTEHPDIEIPIFGNGDINSPAVALERKNNYGVSGIMIGRAAIGYPWIFQEISHYLNTGELLPAPNLPDRVRICAAHLSASIAWKGEKTGIYEMRRHYANYFKAIPNLKEIRSKLCTATSANEIFELLQTIQTIQLISE